MSHDIENTPLLDDRSDDRRAKGMRGETILPLRASNNHDTPRISLMREYSTLLTPSYQQMKDLHNSEEKNNAKQIQSKKLLTYDSSVRCSRLKD